MTSTVARLESAGLITPPKFVSSNIQYEVMMGSVAYGVSDDTSDMDIYGFCIPPKDTIFPPGEIPGFGTQKKRFNQYQKHHIFWEDAHGGKGQEYDLTIYSIIRYFDLVMRNNPNMIDSLFVPHDCVLHCTQIAQMVREKRRMFLHKGAWHTYKGYSFSQAHKLATKRPTGDRKETVEKYGVDLKYAYHLVRLLNEIEQILTEGDLDLRRNAEQLRSIRRGDWTQERVLDYFSSKERELETLYTESKLPWGPDEAAIKQLLLNCLEAHYGSLSIQLPGAERQALEQISEIVRAVGC